MVGKLIYQEFAGPHLFGRLRDTAVDAAELTIELPRRIDRVLSEIARGNLRVWTRIEDIQPQMKCVEHLVTHMNATILAAACIVGLATVTLFYHPQQWQRWIGMVLWIASAIAVTALLRTFWAFRRT